MPREPEFCGCCGEYKKECVCPDGPTDHYRDAILRWARHRCQQCPRFEGQDWDDLLAEIRIRG